MIKVLIADDQKLIRESLKIVLDTYQDIQVIDTVGDGKQVLESIEEQEPDVKWDSRYDSKINSEDKLHVVCINNLKYVLVFEKFELINTDSASIKSDIIDIMTTTNSNYTNKYPIEITFDSKNIEYIEE